MKHELDNIVMNAVIKAINDYNKKNGKKRYEIDDCDEAMFILDKKDKTEYCLSLEEYDE